MHSKKIAFFLLILAAMPALGKSAEDLNITDEERHLSQTYEDKVGIQEIINEKCGDQPGICAGEEGETRFMGINSDYIKMAAYIYGTIAMSAGRMGMGGGTFTRKVKDKTTGEVKETKTRDWCQMLIIGTEQMAKFKQQLDQQNITTMTGNKNALERQRKSLEHAALSHRSRSKNHRLQMYGWGAAATCYAYYLAPTSIKGLGITDRSLYFKAAGAAFMATFFYNESKQHKKYYEEVMKIAESLPKPGDCNPVTNRSCFCARPLIEENMSLYKKYCEPPTHNAAVAEDSYRIPCTDENMQTDVKCYCLNEDSCFDKKYFSDIKSPELRNFFKSPQAQDVRSMMRGELKGGGLANMQRGLAASRQVAKKIGIPKNMMPKPNRKGWMKVARDLGLPVEQAIALASMPKPPNADELANKFANASMPHKDILKGKLGKKAWRFSKVKDFNRKGKAKNPYSSFMKGLKKRKRGKASHDIMRFSERSSKSAQLNRNKK